MGLGMYDMTLDIFRVVRVFHEFRVVPVEWHIFIMKRVTCTLPLTVGLHHR